MSTSRIGRKPVAIPSGVEVKIQQQQISVKGPKGSKMVELHPFIHVTVENNEIKVRPDSNQKDGLTGSKIKLYHAIAGTTRANISNLIEGVTKGFEKKLVLVGVGYRAKASGKLLELSLGYSHPTNFPIPEGITVATPSQTEIVVKGIDKELVGLVAAKIRDIRGPEPYKGKGVRYANEVIAIKETKKK